MDRGVTFSPAMVQALLAGNKTQTRRLASSPLRRCKPGDRLYVREHWKTSAAADAIAPNALPTVSPVLTLADGVCSTAWKPDEWGRHRQAMHMPRWASRMTLLIDEVRVEPVKFISEADAMAEGVVCEGQDTEGDWWSVPGCEGTGGDYASTAYGRLWDLLHPEPPHRFADNPMAVALTFRVINHNIDGFTTA